MFAIPSVGPLSDGVVWRPLHTGARFRAASRLILSILTPVLLLTGAATGNTQGLTAVVTGAVADATRRPLVGATVTLTNEATQTLRSANTDGTGVYQFPDVLPGSYTISTAVAGFRPYEQRGLVVSAADRLSLNDIVLQVGALSQQVIVEADASVAQTITGGRSATISREMLEDLSSKGRLFTDFVALLPGTLIASQREFSGSGSVGDLTINGRTSFNFTLDGITSKDTGMNTGNFISPSLDAIAEIRLQTSSSQAEFGRSSGATITAVTRSGSRDFHGSGAFYLRHEALNENEFDRRYNCDLGTNFPNGSAAQRSQCDTPVYRYNNTAWTLGGPVLVPGTAFNRRRDKLFFFFLQDLLPRHDPGVRTIRRVPTELERMGDFSQTHDLAGNLIRIKDPNKPVPCSQAQPTGCFTDNRIPAQRLNAYGQALLNLLPLPNQPQDILGANHFYQTDQKLKRTEQIARVDWNLAEGSTFYSRVQWGNEVSRNERPDNGWPVIPQGSSIRTAGVVNTLLHAFNATTFLESTIGVNWAHQQNQIVGDDTLARIDRRVVLPGWPQFFPQANSAFAVPIVPATSFLGGISISGFGSGISTFPFSAHNATWNLSANATKLKGSHTLKVGIFVDHTRRSAPADSAPYGSISFNADPVNPCNTGTGLSNALMGCVQQYTESDRRVSANARFSNVEWFLQDSWRVTRGLTVDYGLRMYHTVPAKAAGQQVAQFVPTSWSASSAPLLYTPVCVVSNPCAGASRQALNPLTGARSPVIDVGRIVPGSGDPFNGQVVYDETVFTDPPRVKFGPRLGFAWNPAGDIPTTIRGGVGVYYDRFPDNESIDLVQQPPLLNTYTLNYTTIPELRSLSSDSSRLLLSPRSVAYWPSFEPPVTYNWNVGIERSLPAGRLKHVSVDAAYVASVSRHQLSLGGGNTPSYRVQLNGRPLGFRGTPATVDATTGSVLPDDLLRPFRGVGSVQVNSQNGYADYHSLQLTMRRRSTDGLTFGFAYTYEIMNKALRGIAGELDPNCQNVQTLSTCGLDDANRDRFYNSVGRRPHTAVFHWSYRIPGVERVWNNRIARGVLNDWQVSGVTRFQSGAYQSINWVYAAVPSGVILPFDTGIGSALGASRRVHYTCDPNLPRSERTFDRQFRTECVAAPTDTFQIGDSQGDEYLGLGYANWDITFAKRLMFPRGRHFELRVAMYNAFNTNQWTGVNSTAVFDYATKALVNLTRVNQTTGETEANFGALTRETRHARRIQIGARFSF